MVNRTILMLAMSALLAGAATTRAAVVYEPVQYQFTMSFERGNGANQYYYYGGRHLESVTASVEKYYDCLGGPPENVADNFVTRAHHRAIVYSDCAPYMNLAAYGYTATDAQNEANANVPLYFRKIDLLRAGTIQRDGNLVVAAQARPVAVPHPAPAAEPTTKPAAQPILIIPKRLLEKPKPVHSQITRAN